MAKLQLKFAVAAREENRYHTLDEREVASSLQDWLKDRHSLPEQTATEVADKLAETWRTGIGAADSLEPVPEGQEASSDSHEESGAPAAKIPRAEDRRSKYVVVELPGAVFRLRINPSTPMCAVYVGRAAEKGKTLLARPAQPYREMGRR